MEGGLHDVGKGHFYSPVIEVVAEAWLVVVRVRVGSSRQLTSNTSNTLLIVSRYGE